MQRSFFKNKLALPFILLVVLYIVQVVSVPTDKVTLAKYHISATQAHILVLTIIIPYVAIWFTALVGYLRLKDYTETIKSAKDGEAFKTILNGLFWLTLWLPVSSILGSLVSSIHNSNPDSTQAIVRFSTYVNLGLLFIAFMLIYKGTEKLQALVKHSAHLAHQKALVVLLICFSALYVYLSFKNPAREFPTTAVPIAAYYLPDWLILVTIIIPRLIMWSFGLWAALNIYIYARNVKGAIYKRALSGLAGGIGFVIISLILIRYIESLSSELSRVSLGFMIAIYYGLLVAMAIGYVLIAKGAKSLKAIEEV